MTYPPGVQLATLTFSNPSTFLGNEATRTELTVQSTAGVVWAATGQPIDDFAEVVSPGDGMPGSLTAPFVDQPGITDQAGNVFTMWAYILTRKTYFGGAVKTVRKNWQPLLGQTEVDFDNLPGGSIGLPVSAPPVPVTSVAGLTLAVGAEDLAGELVPFLPEVTPETVEANLPERLAPESLNATFGPSAAPMKAAFEPRQVTPISAAISDPVASMAIQVLGDSTGNETTEWVYLTAQAAAAAQPAYEVRHHVWDSTNQNMPRPAIVRAAPAGERHIPFTGTAQSFPTWNGPAITGDIDVRVRIEPTSWASGAEQTIVGQFPESAEAKRAWKFGLSPSGSLTFQWSTDGTALQTEATSGAWTPPAGPLWVRAVLDVADTTNHVIRFYQSADGTNWTQVNSGISRAGNTSIYSSTAPYQLAGRGLAAGPYIGKIYEVEVRNGWTNHATISDFATVTPCLPEHWNGTPSTPSPAGSPILSFVNGSHPGANIAYLADTARMGKMTPNYGQKLTIVSSSHNEASVHGEALRLQILAYMNAVSARLPGVPYGITTQNPRLAVAGRVSEQAARRAEYLSWGAAYGWTVFDTYGKFLADSRGVPALLNGDGFHPNPTGSQVWGAEVQRVLGI